MKKEFDFIGIGDLTTDTFINVDSTKVKFIIEGEENLCLEYQGKIPYNWNAVIPAVGNAANATVAASRLGLETAFVSNLGNDQEGEEQIKTLRKNKIDTRFVKKHRGKNSNHNYIILHKGDRTVLVKHHEFDYTLPNIGKTGWIYFSSLAENSLPFHDRLAVYLNKNPKIGLSFQPGTFQIRLGYKKLKKIYERTQLFFCNFEEAEKIIVKVFPEKMKKVRRLKYKNRMEAVKILLQAIALLGPKIPVVTDGARGAFCRDEDGKIYFVPPYPDKEKSIDRTGAGDAFSATFSIIYSESRDIKKAMLHAPINSMSVIRKIGSQEGLLSRKKLKKYLKNAPKNFRVWEI